MNLKRLIRAEIIMFMGELKQYYLNYVFFNLGLITMFIGLFYSYRDNSNINEAAVLLLGLVMWQLCTSAFTYFVGVIEDEALMGTLEQIFMTRTSIFKVLFSKAIVIAVFNILKAVLIFIICLFAFNCYEAFYDMGMKIFPIILIILISLLSFYLLGLFIAGLALFHKRVSSVTQIINYILLFFANITIPIELLPTIFQPIGFIVPISWAMKLIRSVVLFDSININDFIGLIISVVFFSILGLFGFFISINRAKKLGKLGHY